MHNDEWTDEVFNDERNNHCNYEFEDNPKDARRAREKRNILARNLFINEPQI